MVGVIGSPGWARTSDFLINRRGPVESRPCLLSAYLRLTARSADRFGCSSLATWKYSRDRRARESTPLRGAFSANQRKLGPDAGAVTTRNHSMSP